MVATWPSSVNARRGSASIESRSSSTSSTKRIRNTWNGSYHSRSQWVWGTRWMTAGASTAISGRLCGEGGRLAADRDAAALGQAGDGSLTGPDVRPPVGDPGPGRGPVADEIAEREQLGLEGLLDRVEGDLAADLVPSGGDPESGRLVEAVGSREPQLHGAADMVEADVLPVCRVVREEVPADRDARSVGQAAREEDGPGRARRRLPGVRPVDRDKVAGDRPDHRQLVDDAAQQRPAVQVTEGVGGRSDGGSDEAVCRRPDRADDLPIDVRGRRSQVSEAELRFTGRMEHGDLDRAALAEARTRIGDDLPGLHDGRVEDLHVSQQ